MSGGGLIPLDGLRSALGSGLPEPLAAQLGLSGQAEAEAWCARGRQVVDAFAAEYPHQSMARLFSAPGRTEICGNHTDHQNGRVLCAAVNRDILAVAAPNGLGLVRLRSAGFAEADLIELDSVEPRAGEAGTSAALIRGIAAGFRQHSLMPVGLDIYTASHVPPGSGLSSSAAFEVLVATILEAFTAPGSLSALDRARIGQAAENEWFGKPSGLMDQSACAAGGLLAIDFADPASPRLEPVALDLDAAGFDLAIIHSGGSHVGLTGEYAAIPAEMRAVAGLLGGRVLREVDETAFMAAWPAIRRQAGDRALLRAAHFFAENRRVSELVATLSSRPGMRPRQDGQPVQPDMAGQAGQPMQPVQPDMAGQAGQPMQQVQPDMAAFFKAINESGASSWMLLQNLHTGTHPEEQPLCVGLAMAARLLDGQGACRVHGGGFGGTFQAFVPRERTAAFCREMDALFGPGSTEILRIRPAGATEILLPVPPARGGVA